MLATSDGWHTSSLRQSDRDHGQARDPAQTPDHLTQTRSEAMDPKAAYAAAWHYFKTGDYDEARESAESLVEWMNRGGFPPAGVSYPLNEMNWILEQINHLQTT